MLCAGTLAFAQTKENAGPPPGKALPGEQYGAVISSKQTKKALTAAELQKKLKQEKKVENVAVKGKVKEVCKAEGCWVTLETENGERFFVKNKDHAFLVPLALEGKTVVVEGNAEQKTTSVEELKHFAEDAKKPKSEIDAITKPKEEVRFSATGIKVLK